MQRSRQNDKKQPATLGGVKQYCHSRILANGAAAKAKVPLRWYAHTNQRIADNHPQFSTISTLETRPP